MKGDWLSDNMPHFKCNLQWLDLYIKESKVHTTKIQANLHEEYHATYKNQYDFACVTDSLKSYPKAKREQVIEMVFEVLHMRKRMKLFAYELLRFCDMDVMDHLENTWSFLGFCSGLATTIAPIAENSKLLFKDIQDMASEFELFEKPFSWNMVTVDSGCDDSSIWTEDTHDLHVHLNKLLNNEPYAAGKMVSKRSDPEVQAYLDQIQSDSAIESPVDWAQLESPISEEIQNECSESDISANSSDDSDEFPLAQIVRTPRKRDLSTTSEESSKKSEPVRKVKRRRKEPHRIRTEVDFEGSARSSTPENPEFMIPTSVDFPFATSQDEVDLILDRIIASDGEASLSETSKDSESDDEKSAKKSSKKTKKKMASKKEMDPEEAWRLDPLLRGSLSEPGPSKINGFSESEASSSESDASSSEAEASSSPNYSSRSDTNDSDDDRAVNASQVSLKSVKSETSPGGSKRGRRNVREIISHHDLNKMTKEATAEELERRERVKIKHSISIDLSADDDDFVLDATDPENKIIVHRNLTKILKKHQRDGVSFMWDNCYESIPRVAETEGGGCILAHCMGLGKTLQVITLIHTLFKHNVGGIRNVLVIVPLTIVSNWEKEFDKAFAYVNDPGLNFKIHSIQRSAKIDYRLATVRTWQTLGGVLLMGYEAFGKLVQLEDQQIRKLLIDPGPDLLVCDEGHKLKNGSSNRSMVIAQIKTKRRIILTGTPMQNNLDEYFHMINIVKPNILGTKKEFRNRFVNPITNGQYEDSSDHDISVMKKRSHVLHNMTLGFIQRFEEKELQQYLPGRFDFVLKVDLAESQANLYKKYFEQHAYSRRGLFDNANILHMICGHPYTLVLQTELFGKTLKKKMLKANEELSSEVTEMLINDRRWWQDAMPDDYATNAELSSKFKILLSIIDLCVRCNERILVFSSLIIELNVIEHFMRLESSYWKHGVTYLRMDGRVSLDKRDEYCKRFNDRSNKLTVFLLTQGVGGLGLNLAAANRVVLMDVSWNPTKDNQSIFRAYRLGQHQVCYVYRLVARGTIEEVIYERSVTKQAIAGRVVDKMQISRLFTESSMAAMYRCDVNAKSPRPVPIVPADTVLAELLKRHHCIHTYHKHDDLLKNRPEEDLSEEERNLAWQEYEAEKNLQTMQQTVQEAPNLQVSNPTTYVPYQFVRPLQEITARPLQEIAAVPNLPAPTKQYITARPIEQLAAIPAPPETRSNKIVMLELPNKSYERVLMSIRGLVFKVGSGPWNFNPDQMEHASVILKAPNDPRSHFYRINRNGAVTKYNYNVSHSSYLERVLGHTHEPPIKLLELPTERFNQVNPHIKVGSPHSQLNILNPDSGTFRKNLEAPRTYGANMVTDLTQNDDVNGCLRISNETPIVIDD